jgi:hypothetical protein
MQMRMRNANANEAVEPCIGGKRPKRRTSLLSSVTQNVTGSRHELKISPSEDARGQVDFEIGMGTSIHRFTLSSRCSLPLSGVIWKMTMLMLMKSIGSSM